MTRLVSCLLLLCAMSLPVSAWAGESASRQVLVLGRVSDDPKRHAEALQPMLDYVVPRLRQVGIREGRILMARDSLQMQSYLRRQRVDWVSDTAVMAVEYRRRVGAELLLVTERGGGLDYHTVFFTWRGSGITSLQDLKGRGIAFQNPYSTSSYVMPAAEMLRAGLELDVLLSPLDRAAPGRVGYVFARSESNVSTWVQKRLLDAGAFSSLDWERLGKRLPQAQADMEIFHETASVSRAIEVIAPDLDPRVREQLRKVLLEADKDPAAHEALGRFFDTRRFVPLDAHTERGLNRLRADLDLVRERLE
ncbi:phosphate/phosphite/phosphonate ABC transporter substrate-binding protein [Xanthomonadaceae bacterium JHOS43]|nr:phosphate/phosphite/phosphonate ABC transporter substrate-binding protein [Xanthomonadaceae bacterium JHOS43]